MPTVDRISFMGHNKGYNTKDDKFDLNNGELLVCENIIPKVEATPRAGIRARGTTIDGVDWVYPFRSVDTPYILAKSGVDLYAIRKSGSYFVLREGAFPSTNVEVCAERIGDTVLIACDSASNWPAIFVKLKNGTLSAANANIFRPSSVELIATSLDESETQIDDSYTVGRMSHTFAVTFVRRSDSDAISGGIPVTTSIWNDGEAESYERIDQRTTYSGVDAEWAKVVLSVSVNEIPVDCTHVRVWVTEGIPWTGDDRLDPDVISAGMSLRFLRDVSITSFVGNTLVTAFDINEGSLAGETHLVSTTGLNEVPPCKFMKYCGGRLWVGGSSAIDSPGRWYFSSLIEGANPSRYLTMFNLSTQFIDTSIDDTERAMGIAVTKGDIIFFCEKDVWRLENGDTNFGPIKIAEGFGTQFPGTITEYGQQVFYLSNRGPAVVSGGIVDALEGFAAGELWPETDVPDNMHEFNRKAKRKVRSFWFQDSWFIMSPELCVAFYAPIGDPHGAWKVVPAVAANISMENPAVIDSDSAYLVSNGKIYEFLTGTRDGSGAYYTLRCRYRPRHIDGRRRYKVAELWDVIAHARWTDVGEFRLIVSANDDIRVASHAYDQRSVNESLQNSTISNPFRRIVQQGLREGMFGNWFEVEWRKVLRTDFWCAGTEIGIIPREGHEFEYVSYSDPDPYDAAMDRDLAIFDDTFQEGLPQ